jgi:hypothetical protein
MSNSRFDVNDADLRESFLRQELISALERLDEASTALWGQMHPQEMVEHLIWAFELSTGKVLLECTVPEAVRRRAKRFLYHNEPTPRGFMNPTLAAGLPPLRYASLSEAIETLARELGRFLDDRSAGVPLCTHPVFGPMGIDEWHRTHYKHAHHHLAQFGLVAEQ